MRKNPNLQATIIRNTERLFDLPNQVNKRITKKSLELYAKGYRTEELANALKRYMPEATRASLVLLARTQASMIRTEITKARAQEVGVDFYIWHTVGGPLVRDSHREMDDVICDFNNPPEPEVLIGEKSQGAYNPGGTYNCRCYPEPILDLDLVKWPHKVYNKSKIELCSKRVFLEKYGKRL